MHKHRRAGIVVDTNIFLLLIIGSVDRTLITRFKRTDQFTPGDFELLDRVLRRFDKVLTTPHILTEVSNMAGHLGEPAKTEVFAGLARLVAALDESYEPGAALVGSQIFTRFGLTDCSIEVLARSGRLILTDDFRLSQYLAGLGADVVNFNHLRR